MPEQSQNPFGNQNPQPNFQNQGHYPQNPQFPGYQPSPIQPDLNPSLPVRLVSAYNPSTINNHEYQQNGNRGVSSTKRNFKTLLWSLLILAFFFSLGSGVYYFYQKRGAFGPKVKAVARTETDFSEFNKATIQTSVLNFEDVVFAVQSQSGKFGPQRDKPAVDPALYKTFTGEQFKNFYEQAILSYQNVDNNLTTKSPIRQNPEADKKIQAIAEKRGYKLRPQAVETKLQTVDGQRLQPEVLQSWLLLKSTAASEGIQLELVSGYRSSADQKQIFNSTLGASVTDEQILAGGADSQINEVLKSSSIPGYSRHHTGFTVDFGCGSKILTIFAQTPCYDWLSKFNYLNAKRFGFIPSYPQGAGNQGPEPEAWEYVWVGERSLRS